MKTVLSAHSQIEVPDTPQRGDDALWMNGELLREATGWLLKPEGLCRGEVCVPLHADVYERFVDGEEIDATGLWDALDRPVVHDRSRSTWVLGEGAEDRSRPHDTGEAPDFTLPDLAGNLHSLSDFRGRKVFLATWASW